MTEARRHIDRIWPKSGIYRYAVDLAGATNEFEII